MSFRVFVALAALLGFASVADAQSPPYTNVHDMFKVGATWNGQPLVDAQECSDPAQTGYPTTVCTTVVNVAVADPEDIMFPDPINAPCPPGMTSHGTTCGYNFLDWPQNAQQPYARALFQMGGFRWWPPYLVANDFYDVPAGAGCRPAHARLCNPPRLQDFNWGSLFRRFGR